MIILGFFLEHACREGMVKCADGLQCIPSYAMCSGYPRCNDKSDESAEVCNGMSSIA